MDIAKTFLVTGGRDFTDRDAVFCALDKIRKKYPNVTILSGACPTGADAIAHAWAMDRERPSISVPAEWARFGDGAGPRRNTIMLAYLPDGCVAFDGRNGTADMVSKARAAEIPVWTP